MDVGCSKRCLIRAQLSLAIGIVKMKNQQMSDTNRMMGAMRQMRASQKQALPNQTSALLSAKTSTGYVDEVVVAPYDFAGRVAGRA